MLEICTQYRQHLLAQLESPPVEPYKNLDYFSISDQAVYYGREEIAAGLADSILQPNRRLLVLHASSGSGKSSLIGAGVIPRLLRKGCVTLWSAPTPFPENLYLPVLGCADALGLAGPDYNDVPLNLFVGSLAR